MISVRRKQRVDPTIPSASMGDIAFLLIIFFMVTTTFSVDKTNVSLPVSFNRVDVERGAGVIAIERDGNLHFTSGEEMSREILINDLVALASQVIVADPAHVFIIKADTDTRYYYINQVMESLRDSRVVNINLLTMQRKTPL